jgi:hypothetical protein
MELLQDVLPASTVYNLVLMQFRVSLLEVRSLDAAATLEDAAQLLKQGETLRKVVDGQLQAVDEYNMGSLAAMRPWDSLEVGPFIQFECLHPTRTHLISWSAPKFVPNMGSSAAAGARCRTIARGYAN